jgi:predicted small integral membrane protein
VHTGGQKRKVQEQRWLRLAAIWKMIILRSIIIVLFFFDSVIWMSQRGESAKDTKAEHLQPATATNLVSFYFLSFD